MEYFLVGLVVGILIGCFIAWAKNCLYNCRWKPDRIGRSQWKVDADENKDLNLKQNFDFDVCNHHYVPTGLMGEMYCGKCDSYLTDTSKEDDIEREAGER